MISAEELSMRCKTKKQLYLAVKRDGYWIPPLNSPICTMPFLKDTIRNRIYSQKLTEFHNKVCIYPPSLEELVNIYESYINGRNWETPEEFSRYDRLLAYLKNYKSDKLWIIGLLSKLKPDDDIFRPDYQPPVPARVQQNVPQQMIPDPTGFLRRMQPLSAKEMRQRGGHFNPLTKQEKAQQKLARIRDQEAKLRLAKQKAEADLQLGEDEDEGFRVKISLNDFEVLKRAKLFEIANPQVFARLRAQQQQQPQDNNQAPQMQPQENNQPQQQPQMQPQPGAVLLQPDEAMLQLQQDFQQQAQLRSAAVMDSDINSEINNGQVKPYSNYIELDPDSAEQQQEEVKQEEPAMIQPASARGKNGAPRRAAAQKCLDGVYKEKQKRQNL